MVATVAGDGRDTTIFPMGMVATLTQFSTSFTKFLDDNNKSQVFHWLKTIKKTWMGTENKSMVSLWHVHQHNIKKTKVE